MSDDRKKKFNELMSKAAAKAQQAAREARLAAQEAKKTAQEYKKIADGYIVKGRAAATDLGRKVSEKTEQLDRAIDDVLRPKTGQNDQGQKKNKKPKWKF